MREEGGHEGVPGAAEGALGGSVEGGGDAAVGRVQGGGVDVDSVAVFEGRVCAFPGCDAAAAAAEGEGAGLDPEGSEAVCYIAIRISGSRFQLREKRMEKDGENLHKKSVCPAMIDLYIHAFPSFPIYTYFSSFTSASSTARFLPVRYGILKLLTVSCQLPISQK